MKKPLIVLAGPTASGKTRSSIFLAKKLATEIVSADSMQVYRGMDIGTAKITKEEMQGIPHHLIDILDPDEPFHVMMFQTLAKQALEKIYAKNKIPVLVGGTGFYINALVNDNNFMESCEDPVYRESLYHLAKTDGTEALYRKLEAADPITAKQIHPNNIKRVARALEFYHLTGVPLHIHNQEERKKESPYHVFFIILTMERPILYQRIDMRVDQMLADGLVHEVEGLLQKGYSEQLVSMQGLGYKEIIPFLQGHATLDEAVLELKKRTRHFAKRQNTWFLHQAKGQWIDTTGLLASGAETVGEKIWESLLDQGISQFMV